MTPRRAYPRKVEIDRAVAACEARGMRIGAVRISPDGTIEIVSEAATPKTDFERWEAEL